MKLKFRVSRRKGKQERREKREREKKKKKNLGSKHGVGITIIFTHDLFMRNIANLSKAFSQCSFTMSRRTWGKRKKERKKEIVFDQFSSREK